MMLDLDTTLAAADPLRHATTGRADDDVLRSARARVDEFRRTTQPGGATPPVDHLGGRRPRARTLVLVGAAAAVGAGVVLGVSPDSTPSAFADYTSTPDVLTPAQQDALVERCRTRLLDTGDEFTHQHRNQVERAVPVVVDGRGSWSHVVLLGAAEPGLAAVLGDCMTRSGGSQLGGWGLGDQPAEVTAEIGHGIDVVAGGGVTDSEESNSAATLYGRAAADVAAVRVQLPDGQVIDAVVSGGWWSVWWPGMLPGADSPATIFWTTSAGETTALAYSTS